MFARLPSDITSLNQNDILDISENNAKNNQIPACSKECIVDTPEVVKLNKLTQVDSGHGEGETKWKGWPWKLLLLRLDKFLSFMYKRNSF